MESSEEVKSIISVDEYEDRDKNPQDLGLTGDVLMHIVVEEEEEEKEDPKKDDI